MSYGIKHPLSDVTWADGTKLQVPPITRSRNGWVYRPQEAIRPGTGKSFGKGTKGDEAAKQWIMDRIQRAFQDKGWEAPVDMPRRREIPALMGDTVQVGWNHPTWGIAWANLTYTKPYWSGDTYTLKFEFNYSSLANQIVERHISWPTSDTTSLMNSWTWKKGEEDDTLMPKYEAFRKDPWAFIMKNTELTPKMVEALAPTVELPPVDYSGQQVTDTESLPDAWYLMRGNVDLLFEDNAKRVAIENSELMARALLAFDHLGLSTQLRYATWRPRSYNEPAMNVPDSFSISVPAKPGVKGQEHRHKIDVTGNGIKVTCGYVEDEERYLEYQQRQAKDYFETIFEDEWTSTQTQL